MSPRAAWRLESIGFEQVYDYVAGKADWGSFGLPLEGTKGARAGEHVRADVPTCRLEERLQEIRRRVSAAGWDTCIVVNESGVVLGRLGRKALASEEDVAVEAVMTAGPSTVRPSITLAAIVERMQSQKLTSAVVTRSDGRLVGVLRRTDAEAALNAAAFDSSGSTQGKDAGLGSFDQLGSDY
jgi:CBS domain-containing protein